MKCLCTQVTPGPRLLSFTSSEPLPESGGTWDLLLTYRMSTALHTQSQSCYGRVQGPSCEGNQSLAGCEKASGHVQSILWSIATKKPRPLVGQPAKNRICWQMWSEADPALLKPQVRAQVQLALSLFETGSGYVDQAGLKLMELQAWPLQLALCLWSCPGLTLHL